jgi:hypothetical protein
VRFFYFLFLLPVFCARVLLSVFYESIMRAEKVIICKKEQSDYQPCSGEHGGEGEMDSRSAESAGFAVKPHSFY